MLNKKKNLLITAIAAGSMLPISNLTANPSSVEITTLGSGSEIRFDLLTNEGVLKFLNESRCGESKSRTKDKKSKTKEAKCGEGKCGEEKSKTNEGKCGEQKPQ